MDESNSKNFEDLYSRMKAERPISLDFSEAPKKPEPTLDEAREDLAKSVSEIAHVLFAKRFGPLVGSVTQTTVNAVLKDLEKSAYRLKGDVTLVAEEFIDRAINKKRKKQLSQTIITVFSRHGCHLCDVAIETLESMKDELDYSIDIKYIDGDAELEKLYGEQVPVTHIDGEHHDFWRVDPERFRACLETHRQRQ